MLIGNTSKRPSLDTVRRIKRALREALQLPEDAILMVTELACLEEECAPVETVIGLLRPGEPQIQHKLHQGIETVGPEELAQVCAAWSVELQASVFEPFFK